MGSIWTLSVLVSLCAPPSLAIFAGIPAEPTEFPFAAQVHKLEPSSNTSQGGYIICGGLIIASNIVLTAAHCLEKGEEVQVIAGAIHRSEWHLDSTNQVRKVERIFIHEQYVEYQVHMDPNENKVLFNDVALLVLIEPLIFSDFVQPIQLPAENQLFAGEARFSGWGANTVGGFVPHTLLKTDMHLVAMHQCKQELHDHYVATRNISNVNTLVLDSLVLNDHPNLICAAPYGEHDICPGDSGSGLICTADGMQFLCGITSWGTREGCGPCSLPTVFSAVAHFLPWINDKVAELNPSHAECHEVNCDSAVSSGDATLLVNALLYFGTILANIAQDL